MSSHFDTFLPPVAVTYCQQQLVRFPAAVRVVRPRRTRYGDFRRLPDGSRHITVNADLSPEAFLITFLHELAHSAVSHQPVRRSGQRRQPPHGQAWQQAFQQLMAPLLHEGVFSSTVLEPLRQYMTRPAATTARHPALWAALHPQRTTRNTDTTPATGQPLRSLPEGQPFRFGKKNFVRGTLRRTRIVCKEVPSGRLYTILAHALVETRDVKDEK